MRSGKSLALLAVGLALSLCACKSSSSGSPDAAGLGTCSSDAECQAGFQCDRQQRRCVCTGDEACPGAFCNAFTGECVASVPGCTADSACAKTEYCNRGLRSCKPLTSFCGACATDAQCGAGSKCAAHPSYPDKGKYCVPQCQAASDGGAAGCSNGLTCLARDATVGAEKLCYPSQGACGVTNACTADSRKVCSADADCGDVAQVCDQTLKACVAKVRSCPAGDACDPQQLICVHGCSVDADCVQIEGGPGYKCTANACYKLAVCNADSDCTDGQDCTANPDGSKSCKPGCVQNADCPLGQSCSTADPKHPKCTQGCAVDSDCALNNICVGGACTATNGGCSQTCQDTIVCPTGGKCTSRCCTSVNFAAACPTSTAQNPSYPCTPCDAAHGCPAQPGQCGINCFPLIVKTCARQTDCASPTICLGGYCQQMVWVQPCDLASSGSCPWKGFSCRSASAFCGSSGTGGICMPDEQAAQVACLNGHL